MSTKKRKYSYKAEKRETSEDMNKRQCLDNTNSAEIPSFTGLCKEKSLNLFFMDNLKSADIYKKTGNKIFIIKKYIYKSKIFSKNTSCVNHQYYY